jgi:hypothetical protein
MRGARVRGCAGAGVLIVLASVGISAQDAAATRVMSAVRAAMAPALPFPQTDPAGVVPADANTEPLWMVRLPEPGSLLIEVLANPLNNLNQVRAERAMAQIQQNIESAQRRAEAQYERAVSEAKRTGKSQEVDGVTLSDEGVAGAKIDADSHVAIEVAFNQLTYQYNLSSGTTPNPSVQLRSLIAGAVDVVTVPSNTYKDEGTGADRYCEGETLVYLGRVARPVMKKRADSTIYELTAEATPPDNGAAVSSLVLRLRGNDVLMADLLRKTNWNLLLELLK